MSRFTNFNLTEDEITRAKALEEKILKYIEKYCIKRNQYNKYSKKLEDGISDSDKDLLTRYLSSKLFGSQLYIRDLKNRKKDVSVKKLKYATNIMGK